MATKIIGWVLIAIAVLAIVWGVFYSFNIFMAKQDPPAVFKMATAETTGKTTQKGINFFDIQGEMEKMVGEQLGEQLKGILPLEFLPKLFNLIAWSIFMWILVSVAGQLAGIGIKLLKKAEKS